MRLFLFPFLCLLVIFAGCGSHTNTTPSPSNTTPYHASIPVTIEATQNDPEDKITIDNITVEHRAGEPTFPIFGNIANGYNEDCWVTYSAKGFDNSGNAVCLTLNVGPINGWGQVYIAAFSSADFTLRMSWADNVTRITVYSQRTTRLVPSPSPVAQIPISVNPTLDDHEGKIIIDNLSVTAGTLDQEYMSLHGDFEPGDPCWLVSGRISNGYDEDYYVAYHADGYDSSGNQVSFTLDAGPILGVDQVFVSAKSSEIFTLHLSWADNVTSIVLSSQMWYKMFP